jgi:hypothetical protein
MLFYVRSTHARPINIFAYLLRKKTNPSLKWTFYPPQLTQHPLTQLLLPKMTLRPTFYRGRHHSLQSLPTPFMSHPTLCTAVGNEPCDEQLDLIFFRAIHNV